jgi:hypothetical protein
VPFGLCVVTKASKPKPLAVWRGPARGRLGEEVCPRDVGVAGGVDRDAEALSRAAAEVEQIG